ncbi:MAG: hypothetical protein QMD17_13215 [Rhodocyclaceae bacterium]|nr:hypothetical protein [Rhodocyclaceae bacterium]
MRTWILVASLTGLVISSPAHANLDNINVERGVKGAAGAAAGGLIGNQFGKGGGNTAMVGVGAATGALIASGCKPTAAAALGGLLGGIIGSQIGQGGGAKVATALGAAAGTLIGADCGEAGVADPQPLPGRPPVTVNQMRYTPVNGFPASAFNGVPPIVSTDDFKAANALVKQLSRSAQVALQNDDVALAMLNTYWATRISDAVSTILGNSLATIHSANGSKVTIPAKAYIFLPSENASLTGIRTNYSSLSDDIPPMAGIDLSKGVQVAELGLGSVLNAINAATAPTNSNSALPMRQMEDRSQQLAALPVGEVLATPDGLYIRRDATGYAIYNGEGTDKNIDTQRLNYIPTLHAPSAQWQNAARSIADLGEKRIDYFFKLTQHTYNSGWFNVEKPNRYTRNGQTIAYIGPNFEFGQHPNRAGEISYASRPDFRLAVDVNEVAGRFIFSNFVPVCKSKSFGAYNRIAGRNANLVIANCHNGSESAVVYSRTYYLDEDAVRTGALFPTVDSLLSDMRTREAMKKAYDSGENVSDVLGLIPLVGTLESGLQCLGKNTVSQRAALASQFGTIGGQGFARNIGNAVSGDVFDVRAAMVGWNPSASERGALETTANCLSAIPLGSYANKGVKALGSVGDLIANSKRINGLDNVLRLFDTPMTVKTATEGLRLAESMASQAPKAASFVKNLYDAMQRSYNMDQFNSGLAGLL